MPRSSESFGELAAALAKAQTELTNPEKSLTATITADHGGEPRSFRYAPLSSGLDIVRKALGQHGIAVVQSTGIDEGRRLLLVTTTLAHSSRQWIASEWPVCRSDQLLPQHRMGAALTYARRYALFALVGIAGEDDLDAPDLIHIGPSPSTAPLAPSPHPLNGSGTAKPPTSTPRSNGQSSGFGPPACSALASSETSAQAASPARESGSAQPGSSDVALTLEPVLAEIETLASLPQALAWARRTIGPKKKLTADSASALEAAFADKMKQLQGGKNVACDGTDAPSATAATILAPPAARRRRGTSAVSAARQSRIDKSALLIGEPKRLRDRNHLRFVASQPCLVCGRQPADAHHLRFAQIRGLGLKVSDEFTVPLCRGHHRHVHQVGNEEAWWEDMQIDALTIAKGLWEQTRGNVVP